MKNVRIWHFLAKLFGAAAMIASLSAMAEQTQIVSMAGPHGPITMELWPAGVPMPTPPGWTPPTAPSVQPVPPPKYTPIMGWEASTACPQWYSTQQAMCDAFPGCANNLPSNATGLVYTTYISGGVCYDQPYLNGKAGNPTSIGWQTAGCPLGTLLINGYCTYAKPSNGVCTAVFGSSGTLFWDNGGGVSQGDPDCTSDHVIAVSNYNERAKECPSDCK